MPASKKSHALKHIKTFGTSPLFHLICQTGWNMSNVSVISNTAQAREFLEPLCLEWCSLSKVKEKFIRVHISPSVSSVIYLYHSFLTHSPISLTLLVFLFSFFICTSPISWCLLLPLRFFPLLSQSLFFLFDWISLSSFPWMSYSLMNEMPFHQDATTAVTQNSICCLVCKIPLWIGALSFSPERLMKDS